MKEIKHFDYIPYIWQEMPKEYIIKKYKDIMGDINKLSIIALFDNGQMSE
jgi:hypothetical protein